MRLIGFFLLLLLVFGNNAAQAQKAPELTQSRILILLDQSSSMLNTWSTGKPKYKAARQLILSLMDSVYAVNDKVEFSLRVFGHQHTVAENNCHDTRNEVAFSKKNRNQMELRLDDITPLGVTAIAYSLEQAAQYDLPDEARNAYSIILITDGGESCGGDICEVMKTLIKNKVYFKPYIVSLENYPELRNTYNCMGDYLQVTSDIEIPKAVNTIVNAFRPIIKLTQAEYKQIIANAPSILKVNVPEIKIPVDTVKTPIVARPEGTKIAPVSSAALRTMKVTPIPFVTIKTIRATLTIPPVKYDDPPPPVRPSAVYMGHLFYLPAKPYATFNKYNWEKLKPMPVALRLPPLVLETPRPAPEKISRLATTAALQPTTITRALATRMKTATVPPIPTMVIDVPPPPPVVVERPAPVKISRLPNTARLRPTAIARSVAKRIATANVPAIPAMTIEVPPPPPVVAVRPAPQKIARATPAAKRPIAISRTAAARMKTAKTPPVPTFVFEVPAPTPVIEKPVVPEKPVVVVPTRPAPVKVAKVKPAKLSRMNVIFVSDQGTVRKMKTPPFPRLKFDEPKVTTAPVGPMTGSPNISVDVEIAKETIVEVYLTDGKGKFYNASPIVILTNTTVPKNSKQFFRTTDFDGKPDPQTVIAGTYNLSFPKNKSLTKNNIVIEPNKKTKITIIVKPVSISFAYNGAPNRPVKEFAAQITERNKKKGRVQEQRCIDRVEYEPGNYHVLLNTFPSERRNVDLDVEGESVVYIDQPGFLKLTSEQKGVVTLWKEDGDRFAPFHQMDLNDPRSQNLSIQPGKYQVHYRKGPGGPAQSEKVKAFSIFATRETEVILD